MFSCSACFGYFRLVSWTCLSFASYFSRASWPAKPCFWHTTWDASQIQVFRCQILEDVGCQLAIVNIFEHFWLQALLYINVDFSAITIGDQIAGFLGPRFPTFRASDLDPPAESQPEIPAGALVQTRNRVLHMILLSCSKISLLLFFHFYVYNLFVQSLCEHKPDLWCSAKPVLSRIFVTLKHPATSNDQTTSITAVRCDVNT